MNVTYEAIDGSGRNVRDTLETSSVSEAVETLRQQGLFVTHIGKPSNAPALRSATTGGSSDAVHARLSLRRLAIFTRQMSMLLASGSGVVPALRAASRQVKDERQQAIMRRIIADLEEGVPLAEALARFPRVFDATYCAVVAAGEASAQLPAMFGKLAAMMSKRKAMRNKVLGALIYPALLIVMCTSIMNVLLFFVIPRFGEMFDTLGVPLPASTAFLLDVAHWLRVWWPVPAGGAVCLVTGGVYLVRSAAGHLLLSNLQTRIPLIGGVMSRLIQAEILRVLGMLLNAKVGVLAALDLARGVTSNRQYGQLCDDVERAVTSGDSISQTMEDSNLMDASICQAVRTGEESGNLGGAISYAADVLDEENEELVSVATKLMEPLILILMGVVVGTVAVSLFTPLFDVTAAVK